MIDKYFYQKEVIESKKKNILLLWPRRSGKDHVISEILRDTKDTETSLILSPFSKHIEKQDNVEIFDTRNLAYHALLNTKLKFMALSECGIEFIISILKAQEMNNCLKDTRLIIALSQRLWSNETRNLFKRTLNKLNKKDWLLSQLSIDDTKQELSDPPCLCFEPEFYPDLIEG